MGITGGLETDIFMLFFFVVPDYYSPEGTIIDSKTIRLRFSKTEDFGCNAQGFYVQFEARSQWDDLRISSREFNFSGLTYNLTDLYPATAYVVIFAPYNAVGRRNASQFSHSLVTEDGGKLLLLGVQHFLISTFQH